MPFQSLPIGHRFTSNGNLWVKQSTRTAILPEFGRVYYFGKSEQVQPTLPLPSPNPQ